MWRKKQRDTTISALIQKLYARMRDKGSNVYLHIPAENKDIIITVPTNGAAASFPMGREVNLTFGGNVAHVFSKGDKNLEW